MSTAALNGADEQAAIGVAGQDVVASAGAVGESGGFAGEIKRGRRQGADMAGDTVLLQDRFHLFEEVAFAFSLCARNGSAGGEQEEEREGAQHRARITIPSREAMPSLHKFGAWLDGRGGVLRVSSNEIPPPIL